MGYGLVTPVYAPELAPILSSHDGISSPAITSAHWKKPKMISIQLDSKKCCSGSSGTYATSFLRQWYLLLQRTMLCLQRDRSLALMRFIIHTCIALLIGTLYFNIGNDASMMFNNFRYIFLSLMFLMFTSFCTMTIICKCCLISSKKIEKKMIPKICLSLNVYYSSTRNADCG